MSDLPPFSPTVTLLTVARVWDTALGDALKPFGLTTRKYALLGHVRSTPGISFSELARRSRITVQSAHAAVAAFASDGLVADAESRAGSPARLTVTPAGELLLTQAADALATLDGEFTAEHPDLSDALRTHLTSLLAARDHQLD